MCPGPPRHRLRPWICRRTTTNPFRQTPPSFHRLRPEALQSITQVPAKLEIQRPIELSRPHHDPHISIIQVQESAAEVPAAQPESPIILKPVFSTSVGSSRYANSVV